MKTKSFGRNLFIIIVSRMFSLLSSVAVGFILPKVLSITDYGFFKVFTLYAVYTALLHFGFVDGILLKLSGTNYEELDPQKMRTFTRFFIIFEVLISCIILLIGFVAVRGEYLFIVIMLAINMVFVNVTTYYQFVSQAVQRFSEYSVKNIIIAIVKLFLVLILLILKKCNVSDISYRAYLIGLNILDFSIMLWYISLYRNITFGKATSFINVKNDIFSIFKSGILLTLAYQVSHLILSLDRQFVSLLFSTEEFAIYSFAYNIVSLISTMVSSVSIVLLPMLKSCTHETIVASYRKSLSSVSLISSGCLLGYFPLIAFINWFLPEYNGSIEYISIVLPAFLFTSSITVVMFTINKVFDTNNLFFKDGCCILILGFVSNLLAYYFFKSPKAISFASLILTVIWFLISGLRLKNKTGVDISGELIYLSMIALGFLLITNYLENIFIEFIMLVFWVSILSMLFHKKDICILFEKTKEKLCNK